ncbi:toll/interleukin-1 receptor domain-containing protein [Variovorax sp. dw_954]|uniref:toll/interleukin-1 receptor domain-containing protein n=1 Tax=Variovorax sp. dw_954 TaxID=2720078 RepID=UPI001BD1EECE|nr:toll/interleukin-1 receptor domain-containing protein [Variovorax sp. dw_954]
MTRNRRPPSTGHALAIARWESNRAAWLDGKYFALTSRRHDLQDLVGDSGTLWIVVSRRGHSGQRMYSLSFRLDNCRRFTFLNSRIFGKHGVVAEPDDSTLFAANDARLLLLALRFEPYLPIDHQDDRLKVIGQSIQTPRGLDAADVRLLERFSADADRWSVFVSYQRTDTDTRVAARLSSSLQSSGVNVFRDQEALRPGEEWEPTLQRAIGRSRILVLVVGGSTHESVNVKKEVRFARDNGISVIPFVAGGCLNNWTDFELKKSNAIFCGSSIWADAVGGVLHALQKIA